MSVQGTQDEPLLLQAATTAAYEVMHGSSIDQCIASNSITLLQPCDRQLIVNSWSSVPSHDVGRYAFLKLFAKCPELRKSVFGFHAELDSTRKESLNSTSDLDRDPRFLHHIDIFTSILDTIILEVGNHAQFQEKLDPILLGLGAKHANLLRNVKMLTKKTDYWDTFKDAVTAALVDTYTLSNIRSDQHDIDSNSASPKHAHEKDQKDLNMKELHQAWTNFMFYVTSTIRQGYETELAKKKQKTCNRFMKKSMRNAGVLIFGLVALTAIIVVMVYISRGSFKQIASEQEEGQSRQLNVESTLFIGKNGKDGVKD